MPLSELMGMCRASRAVHVLVADRAHNAPSAQVNCPNQTRTESIRPLATGCFLYIANKPNYTGRNIQARHEKLSEGLQRFPWSCQAQTQSPVIFTFLDNVQGPWCWLALKSHSPRESKAFNSLNGQRRVLAFLPFHLQHFPGCGKTVFTPVIADVCVHLSKETGLVLNLHQDILYKRYLT